MANRDAFSESDCMRQPFISIFKQFGIDSWKKRFSDGKFSSTNARLESAIVHTISGSDPTTNYIQLPKFTHQSLRLKGRYIYLNFFHNHGEYFVIHVDCKLVGCGAVKISISNMSSKFKATPVSCHVPFVCLSGNDQSMPKSGLYIQSEVVEPKWTTLCLDMEVLVNLIFKRRYDHIRGFKLCCNLCVGDIFVSDNLFVPKEHLKNVASPLCYLLPREMSFQLSDHQRWMDLYEFICFPQNVCSEPDCKHVICADDQARPDQPRKLLTSASPTCQDTNETKSLTEKRPKNDILSTDPVLFLDRVMGFGGSTTKHVVMDRSATKVIFPCHALLVLQDLSTGGQKFMIGHTNKISCLTADREFRLLASGQSSDQGIVRIWDIDALECLAILNSNGQSILSLSLSKSGETLTGVVKDAHFKNMVVVWDLRLIRGEGQVEVVCRGHTEVHVAKMVMFNCREDRMISCGHGNIRLWRIKQGRLKTTPIDLRHHHNEVFVDLCFEAEADSSQFTERTLDSAYFLAYACTKSCLVFEIDCNNVCVNRIMDFRNPAFTPNSFIVTQNYFCIGSNGGVLKMWTRDVSATLYDLDVGRAIDVIVANNDCVSLVIGVDDGSLRLLDLKERRVTPVQSALGGKIINCSIDGRSKCLCSLSVDGSIRMWSLCDLTQPTSFVAPSRDIPLVIAFHPSADIVLIGFKSGGIKAFDVGNFEAASSSLNAHESQITGLAVGGDGSRLLSCSSSGKLVLHRVHTTNNKHRAGDHAHEGVGQVLHFTHVRTLQRAVNQAMPIGSTNLLSSSSDGSLTTFIGSSPFHIPILDSLTLNKVKEVDVTKITGLSDWATAPACTQVQFSSESNTHLIISFANDLTCVYNFRKDEILNKFASTCHCGINPAVTSLHGSDSLALSCGKLIKVFRGNMEHTPDFQLFIGHSEPIKQLLYAPATSNLVSTADAVFIWKFLSRKSHNFSGSVQHMYRDNYVDCNEEEMPRETIPSPESISEEFEKIALEANDTLEPEDINLLLPSQTVLTRIKNHKSSDKQRNFSRTEDGDKIFPKRSVTLPFKRHYAAKKS